MQEQGQLQVGPAAVAMYVNLEFVAQATEILRKGHRAYLEGPGFAAARSIASFKTSALSVLN